MPKKSFLDSLKVADPCTENWQEMTGNEQVRFCSHCSKNVNNISTMTLAEARRLVRRYEGRLCVRYHTDPRTRLPILSTRAAKFARSGAAAGVLGLSLLGGAYAQDTAENVQLVRIERAEPNGTTTAKISGYV